MEWFSVVSSVHTNAFFFFTEFEKDKTGRNCQYSVGYELESRHTHLGETCSCVNNILIQTKKRHRCSGGGKPLSNAICICLCF